MFFITEEEIDEIQRIIDRFRKGGKVHNMYPIRKINSDEVNEAIALAFEVFMQFEASDYSLEGVDAFKRDIVENEEFIGSCKQGIRPIYAAYDGDKIIGIMGMRPNRTRKMCEKIIRPSRKSTLNSSPYGKAFYLHIGFKPLSEEQEVHGMRFTPMKYVI